MDDEERLMNIEIKVARQEDLVETLNQLVYAQQKKIGELESLCAALARHLKDASEVSGAGRDGTAAHERPPHY